MVYLCSLNVLENCGLIIVLLPGLHVEDFSNLTVTVVYNRSELTGFHDFLGLPTTSICTQIIIQDVKLNLDYESTENAKMWF